MRKDFIKLIYKQVFSLILFFISVGIINSQENIKTGMENTGYDTSRIYKAMSKALNGEPIVIGVIGGSITNGYAASSEKTRWANLMADWWKTKFPKSKVTLINAGIGGTGSDIGSHRVQSDLLKYKPDFVVIEFSVNDTVGKLASITMEGLVRQILKYPGHPGIMMLILKQDNGKTALKYHKPVAEYYKIPVINFAGLIDNKVLKNGVTLKSIFLDGLHPVDAGMKYIADFITDELNLIYKNFPGDKNIPKINNDLPKPFFSDLFENTNMFNNSSITPLTNTGWENDLAGWSSAKAGTEMTFKVKGKAISVLYSKHNALNRGRAEIWIDTCKHKTLDAYWTQTWGPATVFFLVEENLNYGEHTLHIKVIDEHSEDTNGNYFLLLNVLEAGKDISPKN